MAKMRRKPVAFLLIGSATILFLILLMQPLEVVKFREHISVLFPAGRIAVEQRNLLYIIQGIMLLVVLPVYILTFIFSWRYRAHNKKAKYDPDLVDNLYAEIIWWGLPLILTAIIAVITWIKTYELDPFKPLVSENKPITIQVVALQWRWLFIYPEESVASLNYLHIPVKTPIRFEITADAPMNSFWIPHLGGQIYAMPKMRTELNLIADEEGNFRGSSANLSGAGFAEMHFDTRSSSEEEYKQWIASVKQSPNILNQEEYNKIATPIKDTQVQTYQLKDTQLFHKILHKYMHPQSG